MCLAILSKRQLRDFPKRVPASRLPINAANQNAAYAPSMKCRNAVLQATNSQTQNVRVVIDTAPRQGPCQCHHLSIMWDWSFRLAETREEHAVRRVFWETVLLNFFYSCVAHGGGMQVLVGNGRHGRM